MAERKYNVPRRFLVAAEVPQIKTQDKLQLPERYLQSTICWFSFEEEDVRTTRGTVLFGNFRVGGHSPCFGERPSIYATTVLSYCWQVCLRVTSLTSWRVPEFPKNSEMRWLSGPRGGVVDIEIVSLIPHYSDSVTINYLLLGLHSDHAISDRRSLVVSSRRWNWENNPKPPTTMERLG